MNITSREKVLLAILITVVILFGGFKFLIDPQLTALKQEKETLLEVQAQKDTADYNVQIKDSIFQDNAKLEKELQEKAVPFFDSLESGEIELFFHQLMANASVSAESFMMTKPAAVEIGNSQLSKEPLQYPLKDIAAQIESMKSGTSSKASTATPSGSENMSLLPDDAVEMVTVSIQLNTSIEAGLAFVEQINQSKFMVRITSLNVINKPEDHSTSISVIIQCFGLEKLAVK